jgi:hypothetical protein
MSEAGALNILTTEIGARHYKLMAFLDRMVGFDGILRRVT